MKTIKLILLVLIGATLITACEKDNEEPDDMTKSITLNITGLENLGNDFVYEGWLIVDGSPVSTGTFSVDDNGNLSQQTFDVNEAHVNAATQFVLSIEPADDPDPAPAATKILAGGFTGSSAAVSTGLIGDFSTASGKYILATPTNGSETNELSGIWFLDLSSGNPMEGLMLPELPDGWKYEGWVVIDGQPVTTGAFTNTKATDESDPYSGSEPLPDVNGADGFFPGEDFLVNAPAGLSFPTDISGGTAVISVEPYPDNSPAPFTLKPLVQPIPASAMDHETYNMALNLDFPTGTVIRE